MKRLVGSSYRTRLGFVRTATLLRPRVNAEQEHTQKMNIASNFPRWLTSCIHSWYPGSGVG